MHAYRLQFKSDKMLSYANLADSELVTLAHTNCITTKYRKSRTVQIFVVIEKLVCFDWLVRQLTHAHENRRLHSRCQSFDI